LQGAKLRHLLLLVILHAVQNAVQHAQGLPALAFGFGLAVALAFAFQALRG
jgi:hypothetical protein